MAGQAICCNKNNMIDMEVKYNLLDQALGTPGIGCSICAANLKRFYCHFNCDPNQDQWASNAFIDNEHPNYPTIDTSILVVDAKINYELTCKIFNTCSAINFVSALGASASPQGFFNLQASQGVSQGNLLMNFKYDYDR